MSLQALLHLTATGGMTGGAQHIAPLILYFLGRIKSFLILKLRSVSELREAGGRVCLGRAQQEVQGVTAGRGGGVVLAPAFMSDCVLDVIIE